MTKLVTQEGLKKLKEELANRKTSVRQQIAKSIKEAKEQGDLSENAEYSEAKREQAENEVRIAELEILIKNSQVVEHAKKTSVIEIGSSVETKLNGKKVIFHIVGASEANPAEFKISNESPLGKAFLGKKKGEVAEAETPGGKISYKILKVS